MIFDDIFTWLMIKEDQEEELQWEPESLHLQKDLHPTHTTEKCPPRTKDENKRVIIIDI